MGPANNPTRQGQGRSNKGGHKSASTEAASTAAAAAAAASATSGGEGEQEPAQVMAALRQQVVAHPQQQVVLTCFIPPSKIGAVIGRKGATILQLQKEASAKSSGASNVRVSVLPESEDGYWTPVVIRGEPVGAFCASHKLIELIGGDDQMDDVMLEIPIPRNKHSAIIGRRGLTIANLSADHQVRIMVPHRTTNTTTTSTTPSSGDQMLFANNNDTTPSSTAAGTASASSATNTPATNSPARPSGGATSRASTNIVQLEGNLFQVEKCCAKLFIIVVTPANHPNNVKEAVTSTATPSKELVSTETADTDHAATAATTTTKPTDAAADASTKSLSSSKVTTILSTTSKKNLEATMTIPPELSSLVPSLTKLRHLGKQSNTVIRRKKIPPPSSSETLTSPTTTNSSNETGEPKDGEEADGTPTASVMDEAGTREGNHTLDASQTTAAAAAAAAIVATNTATQLIITGKVEAVKNAVALMDAIFNPDAEPATSEDAAAATAAVVTANPASVPPPKSSRRGNKNSRKGPSSDANNNTNKGGRRNRPANSKKDTNPTTGPTPTTSD